MDLLERSSQSPAEVKAQKIWANMEELVGGSSLQALFMQGDCLEEEDFEAVQAFCASKEIFFSVISFNSESGALVASNDYESFARHLLSKDNFFKLPPGKAKPDLFADFQSAKPRFWKKPEPAPDFSREEEGPLPEGVSLNAAVEMFVDRHPLRQTLRLLSPLYPTAFNGFYNPADQARYFHYFFDQG